MIPHEATEHATGTKLVFNSSQKNKNKKSKPKKRRNSTPDTTMLCKKKKKKKSPTLCKAHVYLLLIWNANLTTMPF